MIKRKAGGFATITMDGPNNMKSANGTKLFHSNVDASAGITYRNMTSKNSSPFCVNKTIAIIFTNCSFTCYAIQEFTFQDGKGPTGVCKKQCR